MITGAPPVICNKTRRLMGAGASRAWHPTVVVTTVPRATSRPHEGLLSVPLPGDPSLASQRHAMSLRFSLNNSSASAPFSATVGAFGAAQPCAQKYGFVWANTARQRRAREWRKSAKSKNFKRTFGRICQRAHVEAPDNCRTNLCRPRLLCTSGSVGCMYLLRTS